MIGRLAGMLGTSSSLSSELELLLLSSLQLSYPSNIPNESLLFRSERGVCSAYMLKGVKENVEKGQRKTRNKAHLYSHNS